MCKRIPKGFKQLLLGKTFEKHPVFNFEYVNITCEEDVKLLGVDIDFNLSFDHHIGNICKKAAQQLNAMGRIRHDLSLLNRLTIFTLLFYPILIFVLWHGISVLKIILKRWRNYKKGD